MDGKKCLVKAVNVENVISQKENYYVVIEHFEHRIAISIGKTNYDKLEKMLNDEPPAEQPTVDDVN